MKKSTRITAIVAAGALAVGTGAAAVAIADSGDEHGGMGQGSGAQMEKGHGKGMEGKGHGHRMDGKGQGQGGGHGMNAGKGGQGSGMDAATLPAQQSTAPLSASEAAALTYMREEEKLARDVYTTLAGTSGDQRFTRIAASEQRHMDQLGRLLTRYTLADPTAGKAAGEFQDAKLQQLYTDLVAKGSASPAAALQVGRSIEKLDIADLQQREAASTHSDVTTVFQQLERGSNMHLRAFTR